LNPGVQNMRDAASRARILVMEDENSVAQALQIILADEGYGVAWAATGQGALDSMSRQDFDLLVADLRLPDMQGMDVIRQIKKNRPGTEVIVITGYASVGSAVEAMKTGAVDYLPKPFTDDQFKTAVEKALKIRDEGSPENREFPPPRLKLISKRQVVRALTETSPETREEPPGEHGNPEGAADTPIPDPMSLREEHAGAEVSDGRKKEVTQEPAKESGLREAILEGGHEGVLATDREGTIVFFNKTMEAMLGYSRTEVCGKVPLGRLLPFGEVERLKERLAGEGGEEKKRLLLFETNLLDKKGRAIPVQMSPALLSDKKDPGIVAFVRNLREMRKAEQEDADPSRLLQQDKMMSLGRLAASVVHEINNPLAGILNYLPVPGSGE
jgi:two-component system NtrC family sensor kinase